MTRRKGDWPAGDLERNLIIIYDKAFPSERYFFSRKKNKEWNCGFGGSQISGLVTNLKKNHPNVLFTCGVISFLGQKQIVLTNF